MLLVQHLVRGELLLKNTLGTVESKEKNLIINHGGMLSMTTSLIAGKKSYPLSLELPGFVLYHRISFLILCFPL